MKRYCLLILIALLMGSCASTKHIEPVIVHDTISHIEYKNTIIYDSVDKWHTHYEYIDTCGGKSTVDTFYTYRIHTMRDTVNVSDTVYTEVPVEHVIVKEHTKVIFWPVVLLIFLGACVYAYFKWIK